MGSSSVFLRLADAAPGVSGWSSEVCVRAGQYLCIYDLYIYIYIICMEKERDSERERDMSCIIYVYVPRTFASKYECRLVNGNHGNTIIMH